MESEKNSNNWRFGVVGNIVRQHLDDEGIIRYGTKAFCGGTKVYIDGKHWNNDNETVEVIGLNRFRRYAIESVPVELIENVRCQRIYKPTVLDIMASVENCDGWFWWGKTAEDRSETETFVKEWNGK